MSAGQHTRPTPPTHRYAWALPGVTLGVLLTLLLADAPRPAAADLPRMAGGGGLYVAPARLGLDNEGRPVFGAYLLDTDSQRLVTYQLNTSFGDDQAAMRLLAVRDTAGDRALRDFNSGDPDPRAMAELLRLQEDAARVRRERPTQPIR